jgi:hypothetical protein
MKARMIMRDWCNGRAATWTCYVGGSSRWPILFDCVANSQEAQFAATIFHFLAARHHVQPQPQPRVFARCAADAVFARPHAAATLLHYRSLMSISSINRSG